MHAQIPDGEDRPDALARLASTGPAERAIDALGDRWTLLIVHHAMFRGITRFGDFNRVLGIPTNILTRRLQSLTDAGVLVRVAAPQGHSKHEYRLTPKGRDLKPVVAAFLRWGEEWLPGRADREAAPELEPFPAPLPHSRLIAPGQDVGGPAPG